MRVVRSCFFFGEDGRTVFDVVDKGHCKGPFFLAYFYQVLISSHEFDDHNSQLHLGQAFAETAARSSTEVKRHDVLMMLRVCFFPTFWDELQWLLECFRVEKVARPITVKIGSLLQLNIAYGG
jgi:hypothetical protein